MFSRKIMSNARRGSQMESECQIFGLLRRPEFHQAVAILQFLHSEHRHELCAPHSQPMMEFQWTHWLQQLRKNVGGEAWTYQEPLAVYIDGQLLMGGLGELVSWAADTYGYQDSLSLSDYEVVARDAYNQHISNPEHDYVFLDVCVEGDLIGRLVLELYCSLCPRTTHNFLCLCTGDIGSPQTTGAGGQINITDEGKLKGPRLSYVNSLIHRVVPGGWIQGGDVCGGSGSDGVSIYGKTFEDECFAIPHSSPGILGMANHGRNTNNSQFYITLNPAPWMDCQYVAFGRVVEGSRVLQRLGTLETTNERPRERCQISNCGRLTLIT